VEINFWRSREKESGVSIHCKKIYRIPVIFFTKPFRNGNIPHADKGYFGALQRRNFLSFEEVKVFLFLQG
jgi:hypothetical protein